MDAVAFDLTRRISVARYGKILGGLKVCWGVTEATLALWSAARTGNVAVMQ